MASNSFFDRLSHRGVLPLIHILGRQISWTSLLRSFLLRRGEHQEEGKKNTQVTRARPLRTGRVCFLRTPSLPLKFADDGQVGESEAGGIRGASAGDGALRPATSLESFSEGFPIT